MLMVNWYFGGTRRLGECASMVSTKFIQIEPTGRKNMKKSNGKATVSLDSLNLSVKFSSIEIRLQVEMNLVRSYLLSRSDALSLHRNQFNAFQMS